MLSERQIERLTLTELEKSGKWAAVLKQAGAPAGTLAAQIPPRTSPKQGC